MFSMPLIRNTLSPWQFNSIVIQYADEACLPLFEAYVDRDYATSALDYAYLYPTQSSWEQADDREILCFLYDFDLDPLVGSMEGSGI